MRELVVTHLGILLEAQVVRADHRAALVLDRLQHRHGTGCTLRERLLRLGTLAAVAFVCDNTPLKRGCVRSATYPAPRRSFCPPSPLRFP